MLKPGFKSTEFWAIGAYYVSQKYGVHLDQLLASGSGAVDMINKTANDPLSQILVLGYVLYRVGMKIREASESLKQ